MTASGIGIDILYVEDDPQATELLERLLRLKYPEVRFSTAGDGDAGLRAFAEDHRDVVITDINMPGKNGIDMAKEMRRIDPEILLIAVSAYHDGEYFDQAARLGFNHYITKPVQYRKLLDAIDDCIEIVLRKKGAGSGG